MCTCHALGLEVRLSGIGSLLPRWVLGIELGHYDTMLSSSGLALHLKSPVTLLLWMSVLIAPSAQTVFSSALHSPT